MEAHTRCTRSLAGVLQRLAMLAVLLMVSMGARQRTANFIVETSDPNFAQQVAQTAEKCRHDLAIEWLGKEMPKWAQPCVMRVQVGGGAGGATTFIFDRGEVFGWQMSIQGSPERILDSVLPHEITHMVYASHFRQPLPRWADEGGATSVENVSERTKHRQMLNQFLQTGRGIAFGQMFAMTEYPADIMPLYAQGYSLAEFLIQTAGRRKYIEFLGDGLQNNDWPGAVQRHYGTQDLGHLQNVWLAWVRQGYPALRPQPTASSPLLAANDRRPRPEPNLIYHIPSKPASAIPLANLVPVNLTSSTSPLRLGEAHGVRAAANVKPASRTVPAEKWLDPSRTSSIPPVQMAASDPRAKPPIRVASGWHVPGAPVADPFSTQVTRPQPMEQPKQRVLEQGP